MALMLPLILFIVSIIGIVTFTVLLIVQRVSVHKKERRILQEIEAEYDRRQWMDPTAHY